MKMNISTNASPVRALFAAFGTALALGLAACGAGAPMGPPGHDGQNSAATTSPRCGREGRDGTTDCRYTCGAGQYCNDDGSIRECHNACISDENCGPSEFCARTNGTAFGACLSCAGVTFDDPRPACGDPSRTGVTPCRYDCGPGQFCDEVNDIRNCRVGCTSDANCGPSEYCSRTTGSRIGTCAPCAAPHLDPGTTSMPATCAATNDASAQCITLGYGADGYQCGDGARPSASDCQRGLAPGLWCCGAPQNDCERDNFYDTDCAGMGLPARAFRCSSSSEPPSAQCVSGFLPPGQYCCP